MDDTTARKSSLRKKWLLGCLGVLTITLTITALFVWPWVQGILVRLDLYYILSFAPAQYSGEHEGMFAPLSPEPGRLMYDWQAVFPNYIVADSLEVFVHPRDSFRVDGGFTDAQRAELLIDDHSYFYLGYLITDDREALAFADAYRQRLASGGDFTTDLQVAEGQGNFGGAVIYRLRGDMYTFLREQTALDLPEEDTYIRRAPLLIQRPRPNDTALLVSGYSYPVDEVPRGEFPATETILEMLMSLDAMKPKPSAP